MAKYNTRGQGHRNSSNYDNIYNKGYCWHRVFDLLFSDIMSIGSDIEIANHVFDYEKHGNRYFSEDEITLDAIKEGELVEIETEEIYYDEDDAQILMKAIVRLPQREDGEQVVVVLDFSRNNIFVRAAWLNKAGDNHQKGLNTDCLSWNYIGIFGVIYKGVEKFYKIESYGSEYEKL